MLIYAHDVDAGPKREVAQAVLRNLWNERTGVVSTQVLQEFYVNATRKIRKPLTKPAARAVVETYAAWCADAITASDVREAFQIEDHARIGFWDALIIAVAARTARHGRGHITLHLPEGWHREHEWSSLFEAGCGPPAAAA